MKKATSTTTIILSVIISAVISSAISITLSKDEVKNSNQFRVVDVKKLTEASIKKLSTELTESSGLSPEAINMIGQTKAKQMFEHIALASKGKYIIIPRTSAIYTPDGLEITEEIAKKMGFTDIKNTSLNKIINKKND